ncbi:MAG: hypothetical protein HYV26_11430 [Candidatus Hydrogenedentes bacterium]|nr:hypothetical protein [Candidatus Hydrogenedentota bacterium]
MRWTVFVAMCSLIGLHAAHASEPGASVPQMLEVVWSAGTHMPQGMQDNFVAPLGDWLVSIGGFCGGVDDDWKPGKYPRGFLRNVWGLNLADEGRGWVELPPLPGAARQGAFGASVNDSIYVWGGFSYDEPYTYRDGYRLSRAGSAWTWTELPPLPSPRAWGSACALGAKIYVPAGADYDAQRFYTLSDRAGGQERLGAKLLVFDTEAPEAGWRELGACPGTPRCLAGFAAVDGLLYLLGGVAVAKDTGSYANVVDNWRYDAAADRWEALPDLPISASGASSSTIIYNNRYLLLPCGYQYDVVMKPDTTLIPSYGEPSKVARTWKNHPKLETTHYFNHFYVYDTKTNRFGAATPLPFDDVSTITVVRGDTAYMFPGETAGFVWEGEYFGHHPEFVLKGKITERDWQ